MELRLDPTRCAGYGKCVDVMPSMFSLDDWGYAAIAGDGRVTEEQESLATEAIAVCPAFAISAATPTRSPSAERSHS